MEAIRSIVRSELQPLRYAGMFDYVVKSTSGTIPNVLVSAEPADSTIDLPPVSDLPMLSSVLGGASVPAVGEKIVLAFLDRNPTKPYFVGGSAIAESRSLDGAGTRGAAYQGASVAIYAPPQMPISGLLSGAPFTGLLTIAGPFIGAITTGNPKVTV
jgi:hypothetical protein